MTASLRLLRIELRRNLGLWLFPVMAGLAMWLAISGGLSVKVPLWFDISFDIHYSAVLLGPLMGGLAAWMATRNKRCRIDELLSTMPHSAAGRDLTTFGSTLAWGGLAYVLGAATVIMLLSLRAPWGFPHASTILVGLLIIVAQAAAGYAMGYYVRSRFTAPLAAVALWFVYLLPIQIDYALFTTVTDSGATIRRGVLRNLSPVEGRYYDVFHGLVPDLSLWHALWLLGLTGIALAVIVLKRQRTPIAWGSLGTAAVIAAFGAMMLVQTDVREIRAQAAPIPYEPVCLEIDQGVPVCVHPAHERILPEVAEVVGKVSGPFIGIPGGVERVEENTEFGIGSLLPDGTLKVELYGGKNGYDYIAYTLTRVLLGDPNYDDKPARQAQFAIQRWLFQQAGYNPGGFSMGPSGGPEGERIVGAVARFDTLEPEVRRAWLAENFAALRNGDLTLEDLP